MLMLKRIPRTASLTGVRAFSSKQDEFNNIPDQIWELTNRKLYKNPQHPLSTLIEKIDVFFSNQNKPGIAAGSKPSSLVVPGEKFSMFKDFSPLVAPVDCFDALFIPPDHVSRRPTDTYYQSKDVCLRTHTSVHQIPIMK